MTMSGICSRCKQNFYNCDCEQYHPVEQFTLSHEEIIALHEYFYKRAGYISHEFDFLVLIFTKRLDDYMRKQVS